MSTLTPIAMLIDHRAPVVPVSTTQRVMVVAPGPFFSTKDVFDGAVAGLCACGDVDVLPLDYHFDLAVCGRVEKELSADDKVRFGSLTTYASHRAVAMAMAFRPDLMLFVSGTIFPPPVGAMLGQYTRTAVWLTESPYQDEQEYAVQSFYRTAFTNERLMVDRLKERRRTDGKLLDDEGFVLDRETGERILYDAETWEYNFEIGEPVRPNAHPYPDEVYYLPHAYDPARHYPRDIVPDRYRSDVCFIGSPFPERQALLNGVDWSGISLVAHGVFSTRNIDETMAGPADMVPNDEAQLWYAGAKINISHHRTIRWYDQDAEIEAHEAESLNPRVYELAAGQCFQICDDSRAELTDIFGDSIPTYSHRDPADLERVIRYYLAHPDERERCAREAYERVQAHTVEQRMRFVLDTCLAN